jgi:GNAT superfamily N-acetyltransferase
MTVVLDPAVVLEVDQVGGDVAVVEVVAVLDHDVMVPGGAREPLDPLQDLLGELDMDSGAEDELLSGQALLQGPWFLLSFHGREADAIMATASRIADVLTDLSAVALAAAVEQNQVEWVMAQGRLPGVELHLDADAVWTRATSRGRASHACALRLAPGAEADLRLDAILDAYRRACAPASFWLGPGTRPPDLDARLRARGLRCVKHVPAMAAALDRSGRRDAARGLPAGLEVEIDDALAAFGECEHPFLGRMTTPLRRRQLEVYRLLARLNPGAVRHLVARVDGRPVGVGTLFAGSGVAGIYDLGVLESFRRRGVGTALTAALLGRAREAGFHAAVLLASGMGEGVYRRLGFERVATVGHWYYSRALQAREGLEREARQ